jgi:putative acyl-CoA dehydrogenase
MGRDLLAIGQQLGAAESLELGRLANSNPPELLRYDATGSRLDDVRFHPAWHLLMQGLCANRVHNLAWQEDARAGAFVARRPLYAACAGRSGDAVSDNHDLCGDAAATAGATETFSDWLSPLLSDRYDPHLAPGAQKRGLLIGMDDGKAGGSDVLINTTRAEKTAEGFYHLVGHKWFFSVRKAMRTWSWLRPEVSPAFSCLVCFPTAAQCLHLERLKDKLGNRSNASSEVEFCSPRLAGGRRGRWRSANPQNGRAHPF